MLKKAFSLFCCLFVLITAARADSLPIYHRPNENNQAPYETVEYLDEMPFAEDAELMYVDVLGIRQGDCIVITCGGRRMLVDGGENQAVRTRVVDAYLKENRFQIRNEAASSADYYKTSDLGFTVQCEVAEGKNKLISLSLSAADEAQAQQMCENWKDSSQAIYAFILQKLLGSSSGQ